MGKFEGRGPNRRSGLGIALSVLLVAVSMPAMFTGGRDARSEQQPRDLTTPETHFKVERPADMFPNTAETVYQQIRGEMASRYAMARMRNLRNYLTWTRHNKAPYRSATHGARYVNNYGNHIAADYGRFEEAGAMPVGAILIKDSFTATASGGIYPGPMFVMEKMPSGFSPASGDWRYTMIMPDGSLFGETGGTNAVSVEFCIGCHAARERYDHLYFVPEELRVRSRAIER